MSDGLLQIVLRKRVPAPAGVADLLARGDTPRASPGPTALSVRQVAWFSMILPTSRVKTLRVFSSALTSADEALSSGTFLK